MDLIDDWEAEQVWTAQTAHFDDDDGGSQHHQDEEEDLDSGGGGIAQEDEEVETEANIFSLEGVKWRHRDHGSIRCLAVCGRSIIIGMNNRILRWKWDTDDLQEIDVSKKADEAIHKLFLDPSGMHLIIAMTAGENYYLFLPTVNPKPKVLPQAKGIRIESVAWEREHVTENFTREFLLGNNAGCIYRCAADKDKVQYFKLVYDLGEPLPISGLQFETFPPRSQSDSVKYFVMAATPTRYYQFIGGPTFEALFAQYTTNPAFIELPGDLDRTELHFFRKKIQSRASAFVWLTGPGIYSGVFSFGSQNVGDSVISDFKLLPYPAARGGAATGAATPVSVQMTEFHFMVLHKDRFQVINQLTEAVVFEHIFDLQRTGSVGGIARDDSTGNYWLFTEKDILEVMVHDEDQNIWKCYLQQNQFETALQYCKDLSQRDKVLTAQANHYFNINQFELAATLFAKTTQSFEEIALRFIRKNERDALKAFLSNKLFNIKQDESAQNTMICTWLTEIYLDRLSASRDSKNIAGSARDEQEESAVGDSSFALQEFQRFLEDNHESLNVETTYNLISSHGRTDLILFFADLIHDWPRLISHYIQQLEWKKATEVLTSQHDCELYYRFSPILMRHAPVMTTNAWIKETSLEPRRLIPSLMRYDISQNPPGHKSNQAIRYLQHCVRNLKVEDPAIYNYLMSLYVHNDEENELIKFLNTEGVEKKVDLKYALRLCKEQKKQLACIHIFSMMEMYEEAVDLALEINDVELAKLNADKLDEDDVLRKKLWLKVARHVIEDQRDIKKAIEYLGQSEILKIEDILPFFEDFVVIDDFKAEICSALEEYNKHIEELKRGMDEATQSADMIRKDIKELRTRSGFVAANQRCDLCHYYVLARQFYLFPCEHVFHSSCLRAEMASHMTLGQRTRVDKVLEKIQAELGSTASIDDAAAFPALDQLKTELDDLVACECPFCGEIMVKSIHTRFIDPAKDMEEIEKWKLAA